MPGHVACTAPAERDVLQTGFNKRDRILKAILDPEATTREKLEQARAAAPQLASLSTEQKNEILREMAAALESRTAEILAANQKDLTESNLEGPLRDRLLLTCERIDAIVQGLRDVANLPDPVGKTVAEWDRPNGLKIRKMTVPLGVLGVIFESRPNVTVDAVALAIKSGNAIVLRGGKEAAHSNRSLVAILTSVRGLPEGAIRLLDSSSRASVQELIAARGLVDVIIPRGGSGLIEHVVTNSKVPVIETGAGNCHIFVDNSADFDMAERIILNAKTQRPSVCNAAEKVLIHHAIAEEFTPRIVKKLIECGVEVRADAEATRLSSGLPVQGATEKDWGEEYLCLCLAIRIVAGVEEAIAHINHYSTKHSEVIVTSDEERARRFLRGIDSAAVYWNASTRFSDGSEFGFGAEMGISTQKLHCRGPFALAELTSTKYEVFGTGQIR